MAYDAKWDQRIERGSTGVYNRDARELPPEISREVIQDALTGSAVMNLANVERVNTRERIYTLLDSFPEAYWLEGDQVYPPNANDGDGNPSGTADGSQRSIDTQPKRTTRMKWKQVKVGINEIAVMVPIPDNYVDDSGAPLFSEIKPRLAESFARAIDLAVLYDRTTYGSTGPQSGSLIFDAIAAGNYTTVGTGVDLADDIAVLLQNASKFGENVNGFVTAPAFKYKLLRLRTQGPEKFPVFERGVEEGAPGTIYGVPMQEVRSGIWDDTVAHLVTGEWERLRVAVRQDISFDITNSGVIFDPATGAVKYSAFQQDGKILRAVMRIGWSVIQPVKRLGSQYPFRVLRPTTGALS